MAERIIGVAVVGCGGIAHSHAWALSVMPEARLVAVVDIDEGRARDFAQRYRADAHLTDIDQALRRDDIEGIVITTANDQHAPLAIRALDAGKHVLVQKPMAMTLAEADRMVAAADRSGKTLMVSFFEFFHPAFKRAREIIDQGSIGDIFLFKAIMAWNMRNTSTWRFNPAVAGGGILMDGHVHHVALFNWLLNSPQIESVYSEIGTLASDAEVEDTGVTLIRTKAAIAEISGSNRLQEPNAQNGRFYKEVVEIFGTKGTIHVHPTQRPSLRVFTGESGVIDTLAGGWIAPRLDWVPYEERGRSAHFNSDEDPWVGEHRHFIECIRDGKSPLSDGRFGRNVQAILAAGYESAREKRAVAP